MSQHQLGTGERLLHVEHPYSPLRLFDALDEVTIRAASFIESGCYDTIEEDIAQIEEWFNAARAAAIALGRWATTEDDA